MAQPDNPRFEKFTGPITEEGQYMLATDLGPDRHKKQALLPNHELPTDNIFGVAPDLRRTLVPYLKEKYPDIKAMVQVTHVVGVDAVIEFVEDEWRGWTSHLKLGDEYSHIFLTGNQTEKTNYQTIRVVELDAPTVVDQRVIFTREKASWVDLEITSSQPSSEDAHGPYYRGKVEVLGSNHGLVKQAVLDQINETREQFKIPTWRDLHWSDPRGVFKDL
jgi:hypothetical protein